MVRPKKSAEKTESGLYLPPGVKEKEKIQSGYIIKVGPGHPIPMLAEEDEPWKGSEEKVKYIPLQALQGDLGTLSSKRRSGSYLRRRKTLHRSLILMLEREEAI